MWERGEAVEFGMPEDGPEWLDGRLLISHPLMRGPYFKRAVVLLASHDEEGAMGVVLNKSTGKVLADLSGDFSISIIGAVPVFKGGPVDEDRVILCAWRERPSEDGVQFIFGVTPERALELVNQSGVHLRAFLGHSGWEGGQLEGELEQGTWAVFPMDLAILYNSLDESLWKSFVCSMGEQWKLTAGEPDRPDMN